MTMEHDTDARLAAWMVEAAGVPATVDRIERLAVEIRQRPPRATWVARLHDRWAHGADPMSRDRARGGMLAIAAVTLLALAGFAGQLAPGGSPVQNGLGPTLHTPAPAASRPGPTPSGVAGQPPAAIGTPCRSDAPATLPIGPLPESTRPTDPPSNDGRLAIWDGNGVSGAPVLLDPSTGDGDAVSIVRDGRHVEGDTFIIPGWSPNGRWLALRLSDRSCGAELIVSPDGTQTIDVTDYPAGREILDAAWSPDGRWLAVNSGSRVDVFGISPDGSVDDARTVWEAPGRPFGAVGSAWGPDGTLAFNVEGQGVGSTVALIAPGGSTPQLVQVPAGVLAPLAWTSDGAAIVARGDIGISDVGLFRITAQGATRIPLPGVHLHGGKWLDIPEAVVGDRIVFAAFTDVAAPDVEGLYSVLPDGSGLTRVTDLSVETGVTFAPAPDGHRVAVSNATIWVIDLHDESMQQVASHGGGIMDWQPVP